MLSLRNHPALAPILLGALAVALSVAAAPPPAGPPAEPPAVAAPSGALLVDTGENLQLAFRNEMNAKTRYLAAARVAQLEGYPAVAALFRACAQAEQVHADRHVSAIAHLGVEARAVLERSALGTTEENLRAAIESETCEADETYPAMRARALTDGQPAAVRSATYALATERGHARLFAAALATLESRPPAHAYLVCPTCGRTVEKVDFGKCPTCFTAGKKFVSVS